MTNDKNDFKSNDELNDILESEQSIDRQIIFPDYEKMIIEMLPKVNNEKYLRRIYLFIKGFLEQR